MTGNVKCSCGSDSVGIFPCTGASNVGQLSNAVAVGLHKMGVGNMMCTVGIRMDKHILLTDLGIQKNKDLDIDPSEVKDILSKVRAIL